MRTEPTVDWRERLDDPRVLDTIAAVGRAARSQMDTQAQDDYPSWALVQAVLVARSADEHLDREGFHALLYKALRTRIGLGQNLRDLGRRDEKGTVVLVDVDARADDGEAKFHPPDHEDPLRIVLLREFLEGLIDRYETDPPPRQTTLCPECLTRPPAPKCAGKCVACKIRLYKFSLGECTEDGCDKPQRNRGLCRWHYDRDLKARKEQQ